jgi:hypothetical protein
MNILTFLAKMFDGRSAVACLFVLGVTFCSVNASRAGGQELPARVSGGIITTMANQSASPAFLREATFGLAHEAEKCTPTCLSLERIVLTNKSKLPITSYRLGWVVVFADAKKDAEVHLGNSIALTRMIGAKEEREMTDNLAPLVPASPAIRMISYFVAEVEQDGGGTFSENRTKIASEQYEQFWHSSK